MKNSLVASLVTILCICAAIIFHLDRKKKTTRATDLIEQLNIKEDKGITAKLPPYGEENVDFKPRNHCRILVNSKDQLMFRGEPLAIDELKEKVIEFLSNPTQRPDCAESPEKGLITLQNDVGTSFEVYIDVYNETKAAYLYLWDKKSQEIYSVPWEALPEAQRKEIRKEIPVAISEAEPTKFDK